jgi:sugar lactone lactonase YvrE
MKAIFNKFLFLLCIIIYALSANASTVTPVASGLSAAIGEAYRTEDNSIYFVEWNSGELSKINLATNVVSVIESGFTNPESLALLPGFPIAYVTTRDGKLWKVGLSGGKTLIATGLGAAHAIVIDPTKTFAYITDFDNGILWSVPLAGGTPTHRLLGLSHPIGLLMSSDFKTAYISEQGPNRIISVDMVTNLRKILIDGLVNPFFMDWADDAKSALYFAERDPVNQISRLDISTIPSTRTVIASVSMRPSAVIRTLNPNILYVTSDAQISSINLSAGLGGPIITRLGFIPSTSINFASGLATTDPSYFYNVKNISFGSIVHVMLNFPGMRNSGGLYYKVTVDGLPITTALKEAWTNYRWNGSTFVLETIMPDATGRYSVPSASALYAIPDLGFAWDTTKLSNGRHTFQVHLINSRGAVFLMNQVSAMIDNQAPTFAINQIFHDGVALNECALITSGSANLQFAITAFDPQGHLFNYALTDRWGHGMSNPITSDSYIGVHDGSLIWAGVNNLLVNYSLTNTACSHSFSLSGWANTSNGYGMIHYAEDLDHVALYLGGGNCYL